MKRRKVLVLVLLAAGFLFVSACATISYPEIVTPNLMSVEDGVHTGEYVFTGSPVWVRLQILMADHVIKQCTILHHECSWIGQGANVLAERIVAAQTLDLDVVSGATVSSMSILKAAQIALESPAE
jgi:uncharacterized protein with FMN-binding domain